jgi:hypothetical protein
MIRAWMMLAIAVLITMMLTTMGFVHPRIVREELVIIILTILVGSIVF